MAPVIVEEALARRDGWEQPVVCLPRTISNQPRKTPLHIHYHDYIEFLYGFSGSAKVIIGEALYTMEKGDLIVINAGVAHEVFTEEAEANYYVIKFLPDPLYAQGKSLADISYLLSLWQGELAKAPVLSAKELCDSGVDALVLDVRKEWEEKRVGYELNVYASVMRIFVWVLRHRFHPVNTMSALPPGTRAALEGVLAEAEHRLYEGFDAEDAAAFAHLSYSYFSRTFKSVFGISFTAYNEALRLREAERLLLTTPRTVSDIASALGFGTTSYFTERFRLRYGAPPHKFRQKRTTVR